MREAPGYSDHNVDVMVTMRNSLLTRLDSHLREIGEGNRSAWVRMAITARIRREVNEHSLLGEVE